MGESKIIHPDTSIGHVHYTVSDLDRQVAFYTEELGFKLRGRDGDAASLGTAERELLRLTRVPGARRVPRTTGLYHTAFLVPQKVHLAHLLQRLAVRRTPLQGTSNHGTHLAIYLPDPEGNGIELAWDFPRAEWPMEDGRYAMEKVPRQGIDADDLFAELERATEPWTGLPDQTVVGHVHLHAADLDDSIRFYHEIVGFGITMNSEAFRAVFVSAGGYHHHVGMNVWHGVGAPAPPPDAVGLRYYTIQLPPGELTPLVERLTAAGIGVRREADAVYVTDPAQIGVRLEEKAA